MGDKENFWINLIIFALFYGTGLFLFYNFRLRMTNLSLFGISLLFVSAFFTLIFTFGRTKKKNKIKYVGVVIYLVSSVVVIYQLMLFELFFYIAVALIPLTLGCLTLFLNYSGFHYYSELIYHILKDHIVKPYFDYENYFFEKNWVLNYFLCSYFYFVVISLYFYPFFSVNNDITYLFNNRIELLTQVWFGFIVVKFFRYIMPEYSKLLVKVMIGLLFPFGMLIIFDLSRRFGYLLVDKVDMVLYNLMTLFSLSTLFISATLMSEMVLDYVKKRYKLN